MQKDPLMKIKTLHGWAVDYGEAVRIQDRLKGKLILRGRAPAKLETVAGADISYSKGDDLFFAAVVLLRLPDFETIEEVSASGRVGFPYIPGLLTFREGPILLRAFEKLSRVPNIILFDGQGIAHPRGFGLAAHMGLLLDIPAVGCAKKKLIGMHGNVGEERGDHAELLLNGKIVGAALRTKKKVKPVYVSPGHRIGLKGALDAVLRCSAGYRIPEPTRRAHLAVNRLRRETINSG
jgi:deoxyribonuclease V